MKIHPIICLGLWFAASAAFSQTEDAFEAVEPSEISTVTTARILGEIPDGTPPPPAPPKPEYHIASRDVLDTVTHEQGGRTITIRRIKPIDLPPPPVPVEATAELDEEFAQRLAEYRETHPTTDLLFLGATVYRSKDSPPRTLVRYWSGKEGDNITFWSSADFALIAGGVNAFEDAAGNRHHMMIAWSYQDYDSLAEIIEERGIDYDLPEMPAFPEGKAAYQIIGEQPDAEVLVPIQSLHDIYNSEFERLKTAYEGRERARIEHEEWLKANPPQPKDIILNFWREEKPAASVKGGAK